MPSKEEVLTSVTKSTYSQGEVKQLVNSVKYDPAYKPLLVKQGDMFRGGYKDRPYLVVKVLEDVCYAVGLSSTEDSMNLDTLKATRLFYLDDEKIIYVGKGLECFKTTYVKEKFIGVYENKIELARVMLLKKQELLELIS